MLRLYVVVIFGFVRMILDVVVVWASARYFTLLLILGNLTPVNHRRKSSSMLSVVLDSNFPLGFSFLQLEMEN